MVQVTDKSNPVQPQVADKSLPPSVSAADKAQPIQPQVSEVTEVLWTPAELGDDLALWLDVWDSDFDIRKDGGTDYVERWGDLSGNGNDVSQGTGAAQPIKNGSIAFRDDFLKNASTSLSQPHITVVLCEQAVNVNRILSRGAGDSPFIAADGSGSWRWFAGSDFTGGTTKDTPTMLIGIVDGADSAGRADGTQVAEGDLGGGVVDGFRFATNQTETLSENVDIYASILAAGKNVQTTEKIEGWLAHKADRNGISEPLDNLPSDHPYKSEPPRV